MRLKPLFLLAMTLLGYSISIPYLSAKQDHLANITGIDLLTDHTLWREKAFKDRTDYTFTGQGKSKVLQAHCMENASALYQDLTVDLTQTPILSWSWKVDDVHESLDDVSKNGDDYAARIYVVYKENFAWDMKAINYVWANRQEQGTSWPNAHVDKAIMVAQKSGRPSSNEMWIQEERNVREDFKTYFGLDVDSIQGVAIMTDCDNGGGEATGFYRQIKFLPARENN